jgi:hypothetical protein
MMKRLRRDPERGIAAVELAMFLPLLLVLVMGIVDVGRAMYTLVAIQEAAQEGALYGAYKPDDSTAVEERAIKSIDSPTLTTADVTVFCPAARVIEVHVEHELELITPLIGQWFGGSITLQRNVSGDVVEATGTKSCSPSP